MYNHLLDKEGCQINHIICTEVKRKDNVSFGFHEKLVFSSFKGEISIEGNNNEIYTDVKK